jgi:hypothetical protein
MRTVIIATIVSIAFMSVSAAGGTDWVLTEFQSGHFTTSDGAELHYLEAGSGPTLVFVPGWSMPAEVWEHQIRHFSSDYRVVALDPRGQGRSENPGHGYHPSRRGLDIGELIEHLGGEPVVLVDYQIKMDGTRFTQRFVNLQLEREEWRVHYNQARPHSSLGYRPPAPEAAPGPSISAAS